MDIGQRALSTVLIPAAPMSAVAELPRDFVEDPLDPLIRPLSPAEWLPQHPLQHWKQAAAAVGQAGNLLPNTARPIKPLLQQT